MTQASSEVRAAREAVASAERSLASARAAADQAQQVVNIVNVSFRAGAATNIEVIDAERSARDADNGVADRRGHPAPRAARSADRRSGGSRMNHEDHEDAMFFPEMRFVTSCASWL